MTLKIHRFAVNRESLPPFWEPLFINLDDNSNQGIIHTTKPFFGVQFHPGVSGESSDTAFLFDKFVGYLRISSKHNNDCKIFTKGPDHKVVEIMKTLRIEAKHEDKLGSQGDRDNIVFLKNKLTEI
jgi:GMP synthase-like glutamine amidotransferase